MLTAQALIDRLVIATEEQDVLYVLHWIDEMKRQKSLDEAINGKHSCKGYSAIGSITLSPLTRLRKLIVETLLLEGADADAGSELCMEHGNEEVMQFLLDWETGGREKGETARDAVHLSVLPSEKAADWIKSNLPLPPDFESLTRDRPLPTPPSPPPAPPSPPYMAILEPMLTISQPPTPPPELQQEDSAAPGGVIDLEEYRPIDHEEGEILTTSKQLAATEDSVPQRCHLPRPPISFNSVDPTLEKSFAGSTFSATSRCPVASASIDYKFPIVSSSISLPLESATPSQPSDCLTFPRPLPLPALLPHPPRISPTNGSHTLLIVDLPLYGTSESLEFLTNFSYFVETFTIPDRNQTVGFVQVESAEEAITLKKQWNGYAVNGAKVKVVHGEKGLKGKEAVDYHFKNEDEIARAFTRDTGKRRRYG